MRQAVLFLLAVLAVTFVATEIARIHYHLEQFEQIDEAPWSHSMRVPLDQNLVFVGEGGVCTWNGSASIGTGS